MRQRTTLDSIVELALMSIIIGVTILFFVEVLYAIL